MASSITHNLNFWRSRFAFLREAVLPRRRKAVKEQFRQRGVKFYKHAELLQQASEYLAAHPELYEQRAWQMGMDKERINATLLDDERRQRLPVSHTGSAKTPAEIT